MKVQRLIEKYEKLEGVWKGAESARKILLMDLKQLDEPKPVKVPQFVADWIEHFKKMFRHVIWKHRTLLTLWMGYNC